MKRDLEEENKRRKLELVVTNPDWLDLPEPIATNIILEHLDVVDYIRFSAVCKKWHSIQKEHRIRYSPYPPPSRLPFPWLRCIRHSLRDNKDVTIVFHLPNEQRTYKIPLCETPIIGDALDYGHGWLLLLLNVDGIYRSLCIVNPITGVQIKLPPFLIPMPDLLCNSCVPHISSPPTDPDCTILIMGYDSKAYLCRLNDNSGWKIIEYSERYIGRAIYISRTIFCNNKVYLMGHRERILMVDTLVSDPVEQMVEMDCSEICEVLRFERFDLVNFFGELVMVIITYEESIGDDYDTIKEFHVYRADFSTNKWVRMESLGEYALFFSSGSTFSLPSVDVGCKKNTIYSAEGFMGRGVAWRAFNLSTKDWTDGPTMSLSCDNQSNGKWSWFLPTLDYFGVAKTNGACPIQLE